IMMSERRYVGTVLDGRPLVSNLSQPRHFARNIRHAEFCGGSASCDGPRQREPFFQIRLGRACFRIAQVPVKEIRLVSDLEILEAVAQRLGYKERFLRGACRCIRAHPDAVHASPTRGLEEFRQVSDSLDRYGVVMSLRLARDLTDLRMLRVGRVRLRFPVSKLAGVAAKAQNAS